VDTIHRWFDYWLQDIDNGVMDEPLAHIEQQPNLTGHNPTFVDRADFPDPNARRTHAWLRSNGSLSTTQEQAAATASWLDNRDQYVDQYTRPEPKAIENPTAANPNRLAYLSPALSRGVRVSGRSSVTLRISADQADAALGAVLVDYSSEPFETIDYRQSDGMVTANDLPEDCFGESSFFDDGCYFPLRRIYRTTTNEVVGRGAIDMSNRDSLREKTPLTPGQKVWVQVPLWTNDYTFLAGHRIGVVLVGSFRDYGSERKTGPVPTYEINVHESRLTLPVVGGRDALGF
jgi:X-Pro dipeptidyl-peptidase